MPVQLHVFFQGEQGEQPDGCVSVLLIYSPGHFHGSELRLAVSDSPQEEPDRRDSSLQW